MARSPAAWILRAAGALALAACGGRVLTPPPDLRAVGGQVSLFRLPRGGGHLEVYRPDSLAASTWTSQDTLPPIRRVLGMDPDERMVWALDAQGNLVGTDLESRGVRKVLGGVQVAALAPDGSVYAALAGKKITRVVRRAPVAFHDELPAAARALFGGANEQVVAITSNPSRLVAANADQALYSSTLPPGEPTATFWGDLVAIATDTAVVLYETGGEHSVRSVGSNRHPRHAQFSPSGHRLYVSDADARLLVFDRFTLAELPPIRLPGVPADFRIDASGRWLLARSEGKDSAWVVDLATARQVATVPGRWGPDLPLVAGAATVVIRQGGDVVTYDLRQAPATKAATLAGAGTDIWLAANWVPREQLSAAAAAAESAAVVQDSALVADSIPIAADSTEFYVQVSSSQNSDWAEDLARQIKEAGFPASVLEPRQPEDGYRVVVGPYPGRDAAEETGRRLGRAYFILRQPARRP